MQHSSATDDIKMNEMTEEDVFETVELISRAMNEDEGLWADKTIKFHFFCKGNSIDDGRTYFIARRNGVIAGITGLHVYSWGPPDLAWLGWFAVAPEYHGQKIGLRLMNHTIAYAKSSGFRRLMVETYSDGDFAKARRFYERYGFKTIGSITDYIKNGVDMVVFGLEL